ncbi:MAG: hypothetical protein AB1522_15415 [Chloroflexota bacterium]
MKELRWLILISLIGGVLLLGLNGLEYLALTDIYHDYVSRNVLEGMGVETANLPAWSNTPTEWLIVTISRLTTPAYLLLSLLSLFLCWKTIRKKESTPPAA